MKLVYFVLALASLLIHSQTTVSTPQTPKVGKFPSGISPIQRAGPSSNQRLGSSELAYLQARKSKVFCSTWKEVLLRRCTPFQRSSSRLCIQYAQWAL